MSGVDGIGDTEGKAATGSGERAGTTSFKFVSQILWRPADYPPCQEFPPSRKLEDSNSVGCQQMIRMMATKYRALTRSANKTSRDRGIASPKNDAASEVVGRRVSNL